MTDHAFVQVTWGPRSDSPEELAARTADLLGELGPVMEFIAGPLGVQTDADPETDVSEERLAAAIRAGERTDDHGTPWPGGGYTANLFAGDDEGRTLSISVGGGATARVHRVALNRVPLRLSDEFPDEVFRGFAETLLLSLVDSFEPAFGWAAEQPHIAANPRGWALRPRLGAVNWVGDVMGPLPDSLPGAELRRHGPGTLIRVAPMSGVAAWTDPAPTRAVVEALVEAGWSPSLTDLNPPE